MDAQICPGVACIQLASGQQDATLFLVTPSRRPEKRSDLHRLLQARRGYQAMLSERLAAPTGQLASASGALVSCAAFFELLLPAAGGPAAAEILGDKAEGTAAAVAIYEQALAAAPVEASPLTVEASSRSLSSCPVAGPVRCLNYQGRATCTLTAVTIFAMVPLTLNYRCSSAISCGYVDIF